MCSVRCYAGRWRHGSGLQSRRVTEGHQRVDFFSNFSFWKISNINKICENGPNQAGSLIRTGRAPKQLGGSAEPQNIQLLKQHSSTTWGWLSPFAIQSASQMFSFSLPTLRQGSKRSILTCSAIKTQPYSGLNKWTDTKVVSNTARVLVTR